MAELATLARPYAKAAFDYAHENSQLDVWSNELSILAQIAQNTDFQAYIDQPEMSADKKVAALVAVTENKLSPAVLNLVKQLAENGRLSLLPAIQTEFEQLKAQGLNITDVVIETAYPLTAEQLQLLESKLAARFGTKISATVEVNPALIAGLVIKAGDQVIDDSALGKLKQMQTRLLST